MNVKLIKVLRDIRDLNSTPIRRVHPKPTMLYLMELRSHAYHNGFSHRQIAIPVQMKNGNDEQALVVKIKHL